MTWELIKYNRLGDLYLITEGPYEDMELKRDSFNGYPGIFPTYGLYRWISAGFIYGIRMKRNPN